MDYILKSAETSVVECIRTQVQPMVDQQRRKVEEMLREQIGEVHDTLSGKMSVVLRMVDGVSALVETARQQGYDFP